MMRSLLRILALPAALGCLVASCGGKTAGDGGGGGGGGSSGTAPGCVDIDPSTYDQACQTANDCISIAAGTLCSGDCFCPGSTISASAKTAYDVAIASVTPGTGTCHCTGEPIPQCVKGQCTVGDTSSDPSDGGIGSDAPVCVTIDPSTYDQSCQVDTDCIDVTTGTVCSDSCVCGGTAINIDGQFRYEQAISVVGQGDDCPCPNLGTPRCVAKTCVLCGFLPPDAPAGCGDAG